MNILFIGDIVGRPGRDLVQKGLRGLVERMKELVAARVPEGARIHACTLHTNAPDRALNVADWVQARYHCVEHWIAEAGPVIGARAGPGVVGLCWYREEDAK